MAAPKIEKRKSSDIAYIENEGPYDKVPWDQYIQRLYGWAKQQKVMPGFHPMGIYRSDPKTTPPEKLRCDIAITFKGKASESGGVKIGKLPEMEVAALSHKGPGSEYANTYSRLAEFIEAKGFRVSGPSIEVYSKMPEIVDGVTILYAKVMWPIVKR